jgi:hypothetical protein
MPSKVSTPSITAEKRAKWRAYSNRQITTSDAEIDAATEGTMKAIGWREDVDHVIATGFAAAQAFRRRMTPPHGTVRTTGTRFSSTVWVADSGRATVEPVSQAIPVAAVAKRPIQALMQQMGGPR